MPLFGGDFGDEFGDDTGVVVDLPIVLDAAVAPGRIEARAAALAQFEIYVRPGRIEALVATPAEG